MESDSEAPDNVVDDPDYSLEVFTEGDDDDSEGDDNPPGESTSTGKKKPGLNSRGRRSFASERGLRGRGRGFPQGPPTFSQPVVVTKETRAESAPTASPIRPGPSRGRRGRSSRGRGRSSRGRGRSNTGHGGTRSGEESDGDRPGTSTAVSTRGRSRGRGRGRRGRGSVLSHEDLVRVQQFQQERIAAEEARIRALDLSESHELLLDCLDRDPSMLFDLAARTQVQDSAQVVRTPGQPQWCVCGRCRQMITDIEKVCCRQTMENCISILPHMDAFILQSGVLRMARRIWNDSRGIEDEQTPGESNREFRFAAYRQYVIWQYGQLGHGHRVIIPSCCVWRIRDKYPDPNGIYRGFIPSRHGVDEE